MRVEQRWVGLAAGVLSRALRFATSLAITTLCLRRFGVDAWGAAALVLASGDLLSYLDFAVPELMLYEAAHADLGPELTKRANQAVWLLVPPLCLGLSTLLLGAHFAGDLFFRSQPEQAALIAQLLIACACGYPFTLLANSYAALLQGLGRLREANLVQALAGVLELGVVIAALWAGRSLVEVMWWRQAALLARWLGFAWALQRLQITPPRPATPQRATLRAMAHYCAGSSLAKAFGGALYRGNIPLAQAFNAGGVLGAYDVVDRLGSVLQRAANPVWDSLFPRLVRGFGRAQPAADANARQRAQRDYVAGSLLLAALASCVSVLVVNLAPWLFRVWLGADRAALPIAFAPWVLAAWSLNLSASLSTAVLAAAARFRISTAVHALALVANAAAIVLLGRRDGQLGLLAGPLIGNITLAIGLSLAGCRVAEIDALSFLRKLLSVWLPALAAIALARSLEGLPLALLASAGGCLGVAAALYFARDVRSLVREFSAR